MNEQESAPLPPSVLGGRGFNPTGKIANLNALPLCPGNQPFVRLLETRSEGNHKLLADELDRNTWSELSVRGTLLDQNVKEAAIDYDAGLAYVLPGDGFTGADAVAAVNETGRYSAKMR